MSVRLRFGALLILMLKVTTGCGNDPSSGNLPPKITLSPNAPQDRPVDATAPGRAQEYSAATAPYVEKARKSYPEAKARYLAGLPPGQTFFVTTTLRDNAGHFEDVFVAVGRIKDGVITGRIANDVISLKKFKKGDAYTFPETDLRDWTISHPDGSEEGNVVGKFLDDWQTTYPAK